MGTFGRPCFAKSKHRLSEKRQFFDSLRPQSVHDCGLSLSTKSVFAMLTLTRGSAHEIEIAQRFHKNRGRVPRFLYFEREKVSVWELSDDSCSAKSEHRLSAKRQFRDSLKLPFGAADFFCFFLRSVQGFPDSGLLEDMGTRNRRPEKGAERRAQQ